MDLITLSRALTALPNITPAQQSGVPALISAASAAVERYCNRTFTLSTYDEIYNVDTSGSFVLRNFPVVSVERVCSGLQTAMTVTNTNVNSFYRATANIVATDADTPSGLKMMSFGPTGETFTLSFSTYSTISSLAAAINSHGGGWSASYGSKFANWSTIDFRPIQGVYSCLGTGAKIKIHASDVNDWILNENTGELRINQCSLWTPNYFGETPQQWPDSPAVNGFQSFRIQYTAGFSEVPEAIQQAVVSMVKFMFDSIETSGAYKREKIFDYEYELSGIVRNFITDEAKGFLSLYKDFRASGEY